MSAWDELLTMCAPEHGWAVDCYLGGLEPLKTNTVLDNALGGGLMPGLTLLGGKASAGKSALSCQVAASVAASGKRVLYLTLDDSWGNVVSRCMSAWSTEMGSSIFSWSRLHETRRALGLRRGDDLSRAAFELRNKDAALMAASLWEDGPARNLAVIDSVQEVGRIESMLHDLFEEHCAPSLVVIDYVQQFSTGVPEVDQGEYARVSEVAARLQRMSLWGNVPFLVVSSLRKLDKKDDEPNLDWFRGTSQLGYAAWAACVVTRGELEDAKKGWREVVVTTVKNKGGRSGQSVKARLWGGYSCMREVDE